MQPVEIDIVGLETAKRAFESAVNILSSVSARIGISLLRIECELGRQHNSVSQFALGDEFTDHLFALAAGVAVSCINEVSASLDIVIKELARNLFFRAPAPFCPERHRAQGKRAYSKSRAPECGVLVQFHSGLLLDFMIPALHLHPA